MTPLNKALVITYRGDRRLVKTVNPYGHLITRVTKSGRFLRFEIHSPSMVAELKKIHLELYGAPLPEIPRRNDNQSDGGVWVPEEKDRKRVSDCLVLGGLVDESEFPLARKPPTVVTA